MTHGYARARRWSFWIGNWLEKYGPLEFFSWIKIPILLKPAVEFKPKISKSLNCGLEPRLASPSSGLGCSSPVFFCFHSKPLYSAILCHTMCSGTTILLRLLIKNFYIQAKELKHSCFTVFDTKWLKNILSIKVDWCDRQSASCKTWVSSWRLPGEQI